MVLLAQAGILTLSGSLVRRSAGLAALLVVLMVVQYSLLGVVTQSYAEFCAVFDLLAGAAVLLALFMR